MSAEAGEGAASPQVAPVQAPESCGSQCGPQCEGQCDPHAIRRAVDDLRTGGLLLAIAVFLSWLNVYSVALRVTAIALWIAAVAFLATSRYRRRG